VYTDLKEWAKKEMKQDLKDVKLFIVDEYSMVSNLVMGIVHTRLQQVFCGTTQPQKGINNEKTSSFGGRNIALFGDLLQLCPVGTKGSHSNYVYSMSWSRLLRNMVFRLF